jgi:hypothetical protein
MRCEVSTLPPATAAGRRAFTIDPSGAMTVSGARRRVVQHVLADETAERVEARRQRHRVVRVDGAAHCGSDPVKSIVARSRRIVTAARIFTAVAEPVIVQRVLELVAAVRNLADGARTTRAV